MEKSDLALLCVTVLFFVMAVVFVVIGNLFYLGISMALCLGVLFFRRSKGIVISSSGLIISFISAFKYANWIFWFVGVIIMFSGFFLVFWERKEMKEEIRQILLDKGLAETAASIGISFTENPRYIPIARNTFNTYINPSKRAVKIRIGKSEKLYFYDIHQKELYEAKMNT